MTIKLLYTREALNISRVEMSQKTGISPLRIDRFEQGNLHELLPQEFDNICSVIASKSHIPDTEMRRIKLLQESLPTYTERDMQEKRNAEKRNSRYSPLSWS